MNQKQVITRMAPSPTGNFHIGGVRTALYNYLFARQHGGTFILRSEDTDKERSKPEYEKNMLAIFDWLGLEYDAFYRQSERTEIYKEHIHKMIDSGHAYEAEDNQSGTGKVIRFKNPNTRITFTDMILGDISVQTDDLEDFVIARDIENPLYHLTVVVDDGLMGVTHVIRGQEHVANTPRQILLLEALGFARPTYAHLPLIMSPRGGKLSKRDPEVIPTLDYDAQGILPQALLNFLALIGWNPGTDQEIFTKEEFIQLFNLEKVQKGGGVFNTEKLDWINKEWLSKMTDQEFKDYLGDTWNTFTIRPEASELFLGLVRERIAKRSDIHIMIQEGEFTYLNDNITYPAEALVWKKSTAETTLRHLEKLAELLNTEVQWDMDNVKSLIWEYAEEQGKGDVLWPMRYALSGREKSPDPITLAVILGKEKTLERIHNAAQLLTAL
ncbi:MAG: glutamate--tRNA ligase [Candidatus Pacebacteria bacterium]|nr:glutamate--tRNA ligase [Candidatus Paceibacterota bacterium]